MIVLVDDEDAIPREKILKGLDGLGAVKHCRIERTFDPDLPPVSAQCYVGVSPCVATDLAQNKIFAPRASPEPSRRGLSSSYSLNLYSATAWKRESIRRLSWGSITQRLGLDLSMFRSANPVIDSRLVNGMK